MRHCTSGLLWPSASRSRRAFENGPRIERFDVAFADRYFAAENGYFHPHRFPKPTHSWQVTFDAAHRSEPIIVQHMLAGVNAHIGLDLGIVAQTIAAGPELPTLHEDFNRLNAVLASQMTGVVEDINEISPVLADLYGVLQENEIALINEAVKSFRDSAWRFALVLAATPDFLDPAAILARDLQVAQQGALIYDPPGPIAPSSAPSPQARAATSSKTLRCWMRSRRYRRRSSRPCDAT